MSYVVCTGNQRPSNPAFKTLKEARAFANYVARKINEYYAVTESTKKVNYKWHIKEEKIERV